LIVVGAVLFLGCALLFGAYWFGYICKKDVGNNVDDNAQANQTAQANQEVEAKGKTYEETTATLVQAEENLVNEEDKEKKKDAQMVVDKAQRAQEEALAQLEEAKNHLAAMLATEFAKEAEVQGTKNGENTNDDNRKNGNLKLSKSWYIQKKPHRFALEDAISSLDQDEAKQRDAATVEKTAPYEALVAELLFNKTSEKFKETTKSVQIPSDFKDLQKLSTLDLMQSFDQEKKTEMETLTDVTQDDLKLLMKLQTLKIMYVARKQEIEKLTKGGLFWISSKLQYDNKAESRLIEYVRTLENARGFAAVYFPKTFPYLKYGSTYGIHPCFVDTALENFQNDEMTPLFKALKLMSTAEGAEVDIANTKTKFQINNKWSEEIKNGKKLAGVIASAMIDQVIVEVHGAVKKSEAANISAMDTASQKTYEKLQLEAKAKEADAVAPNP